MTPGEATFWGCIAAPFVALFGLALVSAPLWLWAVWPWAARWVFGERRVLNERAGWHASYRTIRFGCPPCASRHMRIEFEGRALAQPARAAESNTPLLLLTTPVGQFDLIRKQWWISHLPFLPDRVIESGADLSAQELEIGWYVAAYDRNRASSGALEWRNSFYVCPVRRSPGTPEHWCLIEIGGRARWCAPQQLDECIEALSVGSTESPDFI